MAAQNLRFCGNFEPENQRLPSWALRHFIENRQFGAESTAETKVLCNEFLKIGRFTAHPQIWCMQLPQNRKFCACRYRTSASFVQWPVVLTAEPQKRCRWLPQKRKFCAVTAWAYRQATEIPTNNGNFHPESLQVGGRICTRTQFLSRGIVYLPYDAFASFTQ